MWFKNLIVYRLTKPFELSAEDLAERLQDYEFAPVGGQDMMRIGFVPPLGRQASDFVHASNGYILVCAKRQEKILPAAVVNEALEEKLYELEQRDGRKPGRKEKIALKDELIFSLMPQALAKSSLQYAYIDTHANLLVVNATSATRAEELLDCLRSAIGSLPLIPLQAKNLPQQAMTNWLLKRHAPGEFSFGHECELRDQADTSAVIRCKYQDLEAEDINAHLLRGMFVNKLGLNWNGGIECVIDEHLHIKRLGFDDVIQERAEGDDSADALAQFDADFTIMTMELSRFITALVSAFGGVDEQPATAVAGE